VAFVPVADNRAYHADIAESCRTLIVREERFAKTAVGWILREISRHDERFVRRVIEENIGQFSAESLKNATKYLSPEEQRRFSALRKWAAQPATSGAGQPAPNRPANRRAD
jgi:3-methyladenine DNA glycosylase AlkD